MEQKPNHLILGRKDGQELVLDVSGPCRIVVSSVEIDQHNGRCRISVKAPREFVTIMRAELLAMTEPVAAEAGE